MNRTFKKTIFFLSILSLLSLSFYGGYFSGVKSEKSNRLLVNKLNKLDDFFRIKNCREDYGQASRKWDCKVSGNRGKDKNCALSLAVTDEKLQTGKVFIDDLELNAKYNIIGLTQVWEFNNGSRYEVEPNGKARYIKPKEKTSSLFDDYSGYSCSAVK